MLRHDTDQYLLSKFDDCFRSMRVHLAFNAFEWQTQKRNQKSMIVTGLYIFRITYGDCGRFSLNIWDVGGQKTIRS